VAEKHGRRSEQGGNCALNKGSAPCNVGENAPHRESPPAAEVQAASLCLPSGVGGDDR
jgi:hypothetical protein